jgi:hypothetical protein
LRTTAECRSIVRCRAAAKGLYRERMIYTD